MSSIFSLCRRTTLVLAAAFVCLSDSGAARAGVPAPRPAPPVPHKDVTGPAADQVRKAFEALLKGTGSPLDSASAGYDLPRLGCREMWTPVAPKGFSCDLQYRIGSSGPVKSVITSPPSSPAMELFGALTGAGATFYDDPAHGAFMALTDVKLAPGKLSFDDRSNYHLPPEPTVKVTGTAAHAVLDALDAAGIDDADGSLLLIASNYDHPSASYQLHQQLGAKLSPEQSMRLWTAFREAARASGYQPHGSTIDRMTLFNASGFTFDGTTLTIVFVGVTGGPPPPPSGSRRG